MQGQIIVGHNELAADVFETVYENGVRIIVNYNDTEVTAAGQQIPAQSAVAVKG